MEMIIFFLITFGINYLFGIPLIWKPYMNPQLFGFFIMLLPANAAILAKRYGRKLEKENKVMDSVMPVLLLIYLLVLSLNITGIVGDALAYQIILIMLEAASTIIVIYYIARNSGPTLFANIGRVHKDIFIFILLLILKGAIPNFLNGRMGVMEVFASILDIPFSFLLGAVIYWGEEYGWRGYLQGKMQRKFGKRTGVILLGIIWTTWHIPFWIIKQNMKPWELPVQYVEVIGLSIFLGYVYMKTKNVWICALLHCIYNIMFAGSVYEDPAQMTVLNTIATLCIGVVMAGYIFRKEYRADIE